MGNVYNHPEFSNEYPILTSKIINVNNKYITTASGSVYELGKPDADYELLFPEYCKELLNGH